MRCKSCNTELAKHAKVCPKCGTKVHNKGSENIKVIAVVGLVLAFIGGLLPFVQSTDDISVAYSYMNIDQPVYWYLFMLALIVSIVLVACKLDKYSFISTAVAGVIFVVSLFASPYIEYVTRKSTQLHNLSDLLSQGGFAIGCGVFVVIIGLIIGIVGCFFDVMKYFKKDVKVDAKYLTNSINKNIWAKMYTYRWFYLLFLPVLFLCNLLKLR